METIPNHRTTEGIARLRRLNPFGTQRFQTALTKWGRQSRGLEKDAKIGPSCQQKQSDPNWTKYEIIDLVEVKKLEFLNDLNIEDLRDLMQSNV